MAVFVYSNNSRNTGGSTPSITSGYTKSEADARFVHLAGNETINGNKTFISKPTFNNSIKIVGMNPTNLLTTDISGSVIDSGYSANSFSLSGHVHDQYAFRTEVANISSSLNTNLNNEIVSRINTDAYLQQQINEVATAQYLVFGEQFTGNGVSTQFQLNGTVTNAQFISGGWNSINVLNTLEANVTDSNGKPIYDGGLLSIFTRHRIYVNSISGSAQVNLDYPPLPGQVFYVWYWYGLTSNDRIEHYYREDIVSKMEENSGDLATAIVVNTINLNGILSSSDNTVQKALETIDDVAISKSEVANVSASLQTQIASISAGVNSSLYTTIHDVSAALESEIVYIQNNYATLTYVNTYNANLEAQILDNNLIDNIQNSKISDLSANYTPLATTANISSNLQTQISAISGGNNNLSITIQNISGFLQSEIINVSGSLQTQINAITGSYATIVYVNTASGNLQNQISDRIAVDNIQNNNIASISAAVQTISSNVNTLISNVSSITANYATTNYVNTVSGNLTSFTSSVSSNLQSQISALVLSSSGLYSINNISSPAGNINLIGDNSGTYIVPNNGNKTITVGISGYTNSSTLSNITGSLQSQITTISSNYTPLSTTYNLTGNLQSQITSISSTYASLTYVNTNYGNLQIQITDRVNVDNIQNNNIAALSANYTPLVTTANLTANLQSQINSVVVGSSGLASINNVFAPVGNINFIGDNSGTYITPNNGNKTITVGISGYTNSSTLSNITGSLQSQINNISGSYATLSYVTTVSGNLQNQISDRIAVDNIQNVNIANISANVSSISANYVPNSRTLTTTNGITGGGNLSQNRTIGLQPSNVIAGTYNTVVVDIYGRVVSGGNTQNLSNITLTGDVTGSGTEIISTQLIPSGIVPGAYTKVVVNSKGLAISGSNISVFDVNGISNYTLLSTTSSLTANLQSQIDSLSASDLSIYTSIANTQSISAELQSQINILTTNTQNISSNYTTLAITRNVSGQLYSLIASTSAAVINYDVAQDAAMSGALTTLTYNASANALVQANNNTATQLTNYTTLANSKSLSAELQSQINILTTNTQNISSNYATLATVKSTSAELQTEIGILNTNVQSISSNYNTILSTVKSTSAELQSQINILTTNTQNISSNYTTLSTTRTTSAQLYAIIASSSASVDLSNYTTLATTINVSSQLYSLVANTSASLLSLDSLQDASMSGALTTLTYNASANALVQANNNTTAQLTNYTTLATTYQTSANLYSLIASTSAASVDLSNYTTLGLTKSISSELQNEINGIVSNVQAISSNYTIYSTTYQTSANLYAIIASSSASVDLSNYTTLATTNTISSSLTTLTYNASANALAQAISQIQQGTVSLSGLYVDLISNQTIDGSKTFIHPVTIDVTGDSSLSLRTANISGYSELTWTLNDTKSFGVYVSYNTALNAAPWTSGVSGKYYSIYGYDRGLDLFTVDICGNLTIPYGNLDILTLNPATSGNFLTWDNTGTVVDSGMSAKVIASISGQLTTLAATNALSGQLTTLAATRALSAQLTTLAATKALSGQLTTLAATNALSGQLTTIVATRALSGQLTTLAAMNALSGQLTTYLTTYQTSAQLYSLVTNTSAAILSIDSLQDAAMSGALNTLTYNASANALAQANNNTSTQLTNYTTLSNSKSLSAELQNEINGIVSNVQSISSNYTIYSTTYQTSSNLFTLIANTSAANKSYTDNNFVNLTTDQTIAGNKTFNNNVVIGGNLYISGTTTTISSQQVLVKDNIITLNSGETGPGITNISAGIEIDRGSLLKYVFVFNEASDTFRIGEINNTQAVSTREDNPINSGIAYWNNNLSRFDTSSVLTTGSISTIASINSISGELQSQININASNIYNLSGSVNSISANYVTLNTAQIISGQKTFNQPLLLSNVITAQLYVNTLTQTGPFNDSIIDQFAISSYNGCNWDAVITDGTNLRMTNIMAGWVGSNRTYTETSTTDIGDTSTLTLDVAIISGGTYIALTASSLNSANWTIKTLRKLI